MSSRGRRAALFRRLGAAEVLAIRGTLPSSVQLNLFICCSGSLDFQPKTKLMCNKKTEPIADEKALFKNDISSRRVHVKFKIATPSTEIYFEEKALP